MRSACPTLSELLIRAAVGKGVAMVLGPLVDRAQRERRNKRQD